MTEVDPVRLLSRLVFVGGSPRSGTTLVMRLLESHPEILGLIHDHVHEYWPLYYYGDRSGLVADLRAGDSSSSIRAKLLSALVRDDNLQGIAHAPHTEHWPLSPAPVRPDGRVLPADGQRILHACPMDQLPLRALICLKSPEISHVLPELASAFPGARFVMVFRPLEEIAESMFRMGTRIRRVAVFHRRWRLEESNGGERAVPPGIPREWESLWDEFDDFSRCVLYAAAYLGAMAKGIKDLTPELCFVYNHSVLRHHPGRIIAALSRFLKVDPQGMKGVEAMVRNGSPELPPALSAVSRRLTRKLELETEYRFLEWRARLSESI